MKRIILLILSVIICLFFSGCINRTVVKESLTGQSENWTAELSVKSRIYERSDKYGKVRYSTFGVSEFELKYTGEISDLSETTSYEYVLFVEEKPIDSGRKYKLDSFTSSPVTKGVSHLPNKTLLLAILNDEIISVRVLWNGSHDGDETIILNTP